MATEHRSNRSLFRARARSRSRRTRVFLEVLEERCLLATDYWTSAASGSWNNAQDWSTGAVPQAGDAVVIDVAVRTPLSPSPRCIGPLPERDRQRYARGLLWRAQHRFRTDQRLALA